MFEKALQAQLKRIFDVQKVSFDLPSESQEQEGLFIEVKKAKTRVKDGKQIALVEGSLHLFAPAEKVSYGFFSRALDRAKPADTKSLFFFNFEENKGTFVDIVERSMDFLYLFYGQYDPALGSITSVDLSLAENL